jgi:ABC-type transport system substrate-binding protein
MLGWTQNLDPDGIYSAKYYWSEVNSGSWGMNGGNYYNEEFNQLIEKGRVTVDPVERSKIYQQLAYILNEDIPELIYGYPDRIVSWDPAFKGFIFGLTGAGSVIAGAVSPYSLRQVYYDPTPEVTEFIGYSIIIAAIPILPLVITMRKKRNR